VLFAVLLAACSTAGEPEATAVVVRETATVEPIVEATAVPTETVVAEPTEAVVAEATATVAETVEAPTAVPQPTTVGMTDAVTFEVLDQYGGVASAVAASGDITYVGFGPRLATYDISDPANPQMLGITEPLLDNIRDIAVADDGFIYLAAGRGGLVMVDANDPAVLVIASEGPHYAGKNSPLAANVQLDAGMAYVTDFNYQDGTMTLLQFDIRNQYDIKLVESIEIQVNDSVIVAGGRLVIVGNGRIEVRNAGTPGEVRNQAALTGGSYSTKAVLRDNLVFVVETGGEGGIEVFDISDGDIPTLVDEMTLVELFIGTQVVANESTLFSVGTFGEFGHCESQIDLIDISSVEPRSIIRLQPEVCVTDMYTDGDLLFVSSRGGVKVFDISNPSAPEEISLFRHWNGFHTVEAVTRVGDKTYILSGEGSGPELLTVGLVPDGAEVFDSATPFNQVVLDLFTVTGALVAPEWQGGLVTLDLSNPMAPKAAYDPTDGDPIRIGDIFSYALEGSYLYMPISDGVLMGGIGIVDMSDPATPELVSTFETGEYIVMDIVVENDYLYALAQGQSFSINIFDVSDAAAPEAVGKVVMAESANQLALYDNRLYAACDLWNYQSLYAIDVTEPGSAEITGTWQMNVGAANLIPASDGKFYMTTTIGELWLLDVSDLANPVLSGHIQLPGSYARLMVDEGLIYAAAFDGGLYVLSAE
jgi:hypothetical protein